MAEKQLRIELDYTYTYDQFTVFFYGDRVFVGKKDYPIGQCCVDVMNLDEASLGEIDQRVRLFIPAAQKLLIEKTDSAAALAQERLNAVWELIFALPIYRDLKMDEACCFHTFRQLMADREKWAQVQDPSSEGYAIYQGMMAGLACFAESICVFRQQVMEMTRKYFEPLKQRNSGTYAQAYSRFYADTLSIGAHIFNDEFEQSFPVEVGFVPMMHPTEEGRIFVAEKSTFNSLADFLRTEFYRGLALGNAPRQCHNCGRYFLLTAGYNTCYCNNIAPGELERTCRKVGAHRKEALGKANRTPARKEYDRTYNRLKARKQRGKISVDEWNAAVTKAQELLERSERGELTDEELKHRFEEF
ncbi:DUF6076 domain-containing protein [Oscillibacter sp.]|jgi:hypothetical protein|uniref:DUF6076 domain-containing protein n=1 Tax=Oscillibacter sp. TaxID=1945593 RepID=UPI0021728866|nr:DUF6076 domain-containing protein [Oscillibacter sp.]MCI9241251.1 hypothetical protein [Oscillibacter sp.]